MAGTLRAGQRRGSEDRILAAARQLFSQRGYSSTTIRAIAGLAGTDPALVTRWFGSKRELFARTSDPGRDPTPDDPSTEVLAALLQGLELKLREEPTGLLATLRSLVTGDEVAEVLSSSLRSQQAETAARLEEPDAEVRAGLIGAVVVGAVMGRYVLKLDGVREASPELLMRLLTPCVEQLVGGAASPPHASCPSPEQLQPDSPDDLDRWRS